MDDSTLESLVQAHQKDLYRYLKYLGAAAESAEDLLQETFLVAYRSQRLPPAADGKRMAGWLRGVARNLFLTHCRKEKRNPVTVSSPALEVAESIWCTATTEGIGLEPQLDALAVCLKEVSDRNREILRKQVQERLSRSALAAMYGLKEEGVKTILRRTRDFLRTCIQRRTGHGGVL